jgi:probable LLM family oxidoreductase
MELGVFTFVERYADPATGRTVDPARRMRDLIEEAVLADQVGLDVFGIGEHHRPDFVVSAPVVPLAAVAERTERIRLTSAVTVLSSDDPVRVFQSFAELDLLSGGRAEIMAGRGSFTESFPLFGYDLRDYDDLFDEKLRLLLRIREQEQVSWSGVHRPPIEERGVYPRPLQDPLPVWVAVGGAPESAFRAGTLGLPMAIAIIGGMPERFAPFVQLHRDAAEQNGHGRLPVSVNSHGYVASTSQAALDESWPYARSMMDRIGRERGWPPMQRDQYDAAATLRGANLVGSPAEVVEKILFQHEVFQHDRVCVQFTIGGLPHEGIMRSIELFGTEVAPAVRAALRGAAPETTARQGSRA